MALLGQRVIRGSDWSGGDVDGGEGHVGTVVSVGGLQTAEVLWDNGKRNTCRIGQNGKYDLKVFDNGTAGVRHTQFICTVCSERGIFGMRWKCTVCADCNLCPVCYVTDKHDIHHEFIRYTTPEDPGTKVTKRAVAVKVQAMGIFPGAIVKRGQDWKWDNQDGGDGNTGEVMSMRNHESSNSSRNIAGVKWSSSGKSYTYRIGAGGKVDLQFTQEARGIFYYKDHLPACEKLGQGKVQASLTVTNTDVLKDGDKVCIMVTKDQMEAMQREHSCFVSGMLNCVGKIGEIKSFAPSGDAMVEFEGLQYRFFPGVLKKVKITDPKVGDIVRILSDIEQVKILQQRHGGYVSNMDEFCGKVGQVAKKDSDGDIVVKFGRRVFSYNPACCEPAPGQTVYEADGAVSIDLSDLNQHLLQLMGGLFNLEGSTSILVLHKAISEGDSAKALSLIRNNPKVVHSEHGGVTALVLASHEGLTDVVEELITKGADINKLDHQGNTCLIAALVGKKREIAKLLINNGVDVNIIPTDKQTAVHIAAHNDYDDVLLLMIQKGCDVNVQDADGDTALHDAILVDQTKAAKMLLRAKNIDLTLTNKKGFNLLQFAALKDRPVIVEAILDKDRQQVNSKKSDGFTPLHIATFNNHSNCARILLQKGKADIDNKASDGLTPLHLACHRGFLESVQVLLEHNADVNIKDKDSDTPLHLALGGRDSSGDQQQQLLLALLGMNTENKEGRIKIACHLIQRGASLTVTNNKGGTPLDVCSDNAMKEVVNKFARERGVASPAAQVQTQGLRLDKLITLPCLGCHSKPAEIELKPCDHTCLCSQCALKLEKCPLCDEAILQRLRHRSGPEKRDPCPVQ